MPAVFAVAARLLQKNRNLHRYGKSRGHVKEILLRRQSTVRQANRSHGPGIGEGAREPFSGRHFQGQHISWHALKNGLLSFS